MRSSHGGEILKHTQYQEFKDFDYFKQIFKGSSDLQLKEILPSYIHKLNTRNLDHDKYIFFTEKSIDGILAGSKLPETIQTLSKRIPLICITKHLDQVLTKMINLRIPVLNNLKTQSRFILLMMSKIHSFAFNRIIRRNNQPLDGLFFIVSGEIKITDQGTTNKIIGVGNFLGLQEVAQNQQCWSKTITSNCNEVILWFLQKDALEFEIGNDQKTLKQKLTEFYQKDIVTMEKEKENRISSLKNNNFHLNFYNKKSLKTQKLQSKPHSSSNLKSAKGIIKMTTFLKRCQDFKAQTNAYKDVGFNEYLKKKKILVKLEQTMKISKENMNGIRDQRFIRALKINQQPTALSKINNKQSRRGIMSSSRTFMNFKLKNNEMNIEKQNSKNNSRDFCKTIFRKINSNQTKSEDIDNDSKLMTVTHLSGF